MSYQALYRTWRPQRFDEIVGQPVITRTLKNALITDQISHAYLFTGPRGTGKTSAAKILAKAVNCKNLKDGEPDNECETCVAINKGALGDVIEIDAASNNGVEEIRNIRDKAKYAPTEAKYKVYIIDEVHMLSTGAFNALLKTLEEPPAHVIFILATTEPQKIPATIISRTQRFDFQRIKSKDILDRMKYILDYQKIAYDDQGLEIIAKTAEGGMRDALSILDQALSYSRDKVTYESALQVTGSVTKENLEEFVKDIINDDASAGLKVVNDILAGGKDAVQFIEELIDYFQRVLLFKQDNSMVDETELGILGTDFKVIAAKLNSQLVYRYVEIANDIENQMRFSNHPDVYLDILMVKLAQADVTVSSETTAEPQQDQKLQQTIADLKSQVNNLNQKLANHAEAGKTAYQSEAINEKPVKKTKQLGDDTASTKVDLTAIYQILKAATKNDLLKYRDVWGELINNLDVTQRALMHVAKPVAASPKGVVISFDYQFLYEKAGSDTSLMDALKKGLSAIFGMVPEIVFVPTDQWPKIRKEYLKSHNVGEPHTNSEKNTKQEPKTVKKAQEMFGDDIINIQND